MRAHLSSIPSSDVVTRAVRQAIGIIVLAFSLVALASFWEVAEAVKCKTLSLDGVYQFREMQINSPTSPISPPQQLISTLGTITFDGQGGLTFQLNERRVQAFGGLTTSSSSGAGTYIVNSDCTVDITTPGGGLKGVLVLAGRIFLVTELVPMLANESVMGIGIFQEQ